MDMLVSKEEVNEIVRYIEKLDGNYKHVFIMHIINDIEISDISYILECDENTVHDYLNHVLSLLEKHILSYKNISSSMLVPYLKSIYEEYEKMIDVNDELSYKLVDYINKDTLKYLEVNKHEKHRFITYDVIKQGVKFLMFVIVLGVILMMFHNVVDLNEKKTILEQMESIYQTYVNAENDYYFKLNQKQINDLYNKVKNKKNINLSEYEKYLIHDDAIKYRSYLTVGHGFKSTDFIFEDFNHDGVRDLLVMYNLDSDNIYFDTDDAHGILKEIPINYLTYYELLTINDEDEIEVIWKYGISTVQYSHTYDLSFKDDKIYIVRKVGHRIRHYDDTYSMYFYNEKDVFSYVNNEVTLIDRYLSDEIDYYHDETYKQLLNYESTMDQYPVIKLDGIH